MTQFEIAQIANLCPVTAEEAKSIIPRYARHLVSRGCATSQFLRPFLAMYSLVKIDDDKLQPLLDEIQTMRKFQS